jgi:hypothetical protein
MWHDRGALHELKKTLFLSVTLLLMLAGCGSGLAPGIAIQNVTVIDGEYVVYEGKSTPEIGRQNQTASPETLAEIPCHSESGLPLRERCTR